MFGFVAGDKLVYKCRISNTTFSSQFINGLNKLFEYLSLASSAQCNVTLQVIGPIRKLRRKGNGVNMVPGSGDKERSNALAYYIRKVALNWSQLHPLKINWSASFWPITRDSSSAPPQPQPWRHDNYYNSIQHS